MIDKELIEIYASVSRAGNQYFIDLNYIFNSSKGVENYGPHGQGAPVKVHLLNKESLYFLYGSESYEVSNITLIRDQLQCLKNTEI